MKHDRNLHANTGLRGSARPKRSMPVQQALEWAFGKEKAELELPERPDPDRGQGFGFGLEYILIQRAALGCKIDGGQHKVGSYTHEDAEVVAAIVAGMPDSLGGKRLLVMHGMLRRSLKIGLPLCAQMGRSLRYARC